MSHNALYRWHATTLAVVVAGVLAVPANGAAQTVTGQARAVQAATALGTTVLADTGTLGSTSDARDAALAVGSIGSVFGGDVLHAVTIGWPDQVVSQVSVGNVGVRVGTTSIAADVVMASVVASLDAVTSAGSLIGNLSINGVPVAVTGQPNQRIFIPGGRIVINEQTVSGAGTTVNALHATVAGVADVVIASATAGIQ